MDETGAGMENPDTARSLSEIDGILRDIWTDPKPLLRYGSCFELLCAVMLSAQCTDEQVNAVTPALFSRYPDPAALAGASPADVESIIHSVGFFRSKARHLIETASIIASRHGGRVPQSIEELVTLPGVGRKTANLVSSACFGSPGVIVDTHVMRVALRIGLCDRKDPARIETVIRANMAPERLTPFSHELNRHGKYVCRARKPACRTAGETCPIEALCLKQDLAPAAIPQI